MNGQRRHLAVSGELVRETLEILPMEPKIGIKWEGRSVEMEKALSDGDNFDFTRDDILDMIQHFVESSHFIGFDPLPHLQSTFPKFEWQYYELPDVDEETQAAMLEEIVGKADFFWPVAGGANAEDWLVARKGGEQKRLRFCGCRELLEDIKAFRAKNSPKLEELPKEMRVVWLLSSRVANAFGKVINGRPDL